MKPIANLGGPKVLSSTVPFFQLAEMMSNTTVFRAPTLRTASPG